MNEMLNGGAIVEHSIAQKGLSWKTKQLQDYVDNAAIGLHWVDANGIIIWANKAELNMLGYKEDEYIGHHISKFHVDINKIQDILLRLSLNETLEGYESEMRCKDGSTRIVSISSNVLWEERKFIHTRCFTINVTKQKELYDDLKQSETRYKNLVDTLPAGVYTCDKTGRITFFNELAAKLWGYTPDINDSSLKFCACFKMWMMDGTFVTPEQTPMAVALQTGRSFRNSEAVVERPDGSRFYANVNIDPTFDLYHNVTGAVNIFQDITNLKETEIALQESENRYRTLIENLSTPLYTTDVEGRITLYNKAAADLWGREPNIGKDLWCGSYKIFKTDGTELPLNQCPMAICLKEQRSVLGEEILVVRPDGSLRNVAPNPQPVFDKTGQIVGAINMLVDITEIKRTEQALRESEKKYKELSTSLEKTVEEKVLELNKSEERYHKMIDEVEDYAIILLDINGIIMNWNKGAEKIKGYREEEIIGKSFSLFYLKEDRDNGLPKKLITEASNNGRASIEGWRLRSDGSKFWGSVVITALHNDNGGVMGFTKVTRDLTEKKLAEDELKEYSAELEFQNRELEQFAYAASHDMKEPLRKIHLYNSYIKENAFNTLDGRMQEYLSRSISAVDRMEILIENLLAYSKMVSYIESYDAVNFNTVIEEIALEHKDELEQTNSVLEIGVLPVIRAVPFQCKQLLQNLLSNAIKYKIPERPSRIKVSSELVKGHQIPGGKARSDSKYHKISIQDNGIGFEPEYAEKIFEVFQRLNNASDIKGSGVGLAICKKILQNHKGFITAEGKLNEGARFDIYFPITNESSRQ